MKKLMVLIALFCMLLAVNVLGTDTATINVPSTAGTLDASGTDINVTFDLDSSTNASVSCALFLYSSSTANSSSSTLLANLTNTTTSGMNNMTINYTLASADVIEDANDYTLGATCYHDKGEFSATSVTSVIVDRTTPSAPTSSYVNGDEFDDDDSNTLTYTVTGTDTISCRIAFLSGGDSPRFTGTNTFAMTHSGNSCTYTVNNYDIPDGSYDVYVQASDGSDTATSAKLNLGVDTQANDVPDSDVSVDVAGQVVSKQNVKKVLMWGGVPLLIYLLFFNNGGKGKKR